MTMIYTPIVNTTFVKIYEYIACFKEHLVTFTEEILNRKLHFLCGDFSVEKAHNISHIYIRITGLISIQRRKSYDMFFNIIRVMSVWLILRSATY